MKKRIMNPQFLLRDAVQTSPILRALYILWRSYVMDFDPKPLYNDCVESLYVELLSVMGKKSF